MYFDWKYKLSRCKNTFFSRFYKIIIIVFFPIYHRIVQNIPEIWLYRQLFVSLQRQKIKQNKKYGKRQERSINVVNRV